MKMRETSRVQDKKPVVNNCRELEELGLLKMDFLGLRNMTIERLAIESINERFFSDDEYEEESEHESEHEIV